MRLLYVGARVVGRRCLEALLDDGTAQVAGVLELSADRREETTAFAAFDDLVERHAIERRTFAALHDPQLVAWARALDPDLGAVIGVSQLVGRELLAVPPLGFLGMHPTLLPQGRGRAPIPWALIEGLSETGVSIFRCAEGADTGPLYAQERVPVHYEDVSSSLGARTDEVAARLLVETVRRLAAGTAVAAPQDESRATTWPRRRPEDGAIDWGRSQREVYDWVRALTHPYPGAFTALDGRRIDVWAARESADERRGMPGEVLARLPHGLLVATGAGSVLLTNVAWHDRGGEVDAPVGAVLELP